MERADRPRRATLLIGRIVDGPPLCYEARLVIDQARTGKLPAAPLWSWVNLFSLDAIVIGMIWQWVFTLEFCGRWPWVYEFATIALSIWLVYTADRLFDSLRLDRSRPHALRHRVHYEYRKALTGMWLAVLVVDTFLIVRYASEVQLRWGYAIVASILAYLAAVHVGGLAGRRHATIGTRDSRSIGSGESRRFTGVSYFDRVRGDSIRRASGWLPKELMAGLVFAFGVSGAAWAEADVGESIELFLATLMAGGLFAANCFVIACWEQRLDSSQGFHSWSTRFPTANRWLPSVLILQTAGAGLLVGCGFLPMRLSACLIASDVLLLAFYLASRDSRGMRQVAHGPIAIVSPYGLIADAALVVPPAVWFCFSALLIR